MTEKRQPAKANETKKPYVKPVVESGKIYERLALACTKAVTIPPASCSSRIGLNS